MNTPDEIDRIADALRDAIYEHPRHGAIWLESRLDDVSPENILAILDRIATVTAERDDARKSGEDLAQMLIQRDKEAEAAIVGRDLMRGQISALRTLNEELSARVYELEKNTGEFVKAQQRELLSVAAERGSLSKLVKDAGEALEPFDKIGASLMKGADTAIGLTEEDFSRARAVHARIKLQTQPIPAPQPTPDSD